MNWKTIFPPIGAALVLFFSSACEKVLEEPAFDTTPRIELLEVSSTELLEFRDSLSIRLAYEDGDGDLGNDDPDINSIFVRDERLAEADEYYLAPLAPLDAEISIKGTLNLKLSSTFLLGNGTEETTIFRIYLVDRAGNQSNTVSTGPVTILRE